MTRTDSRTNIKKGSVRLYTHKRKKFRVVYNSPKSANIFTIKGNYLGTVETGNKVLRTDIIKYIDFISSYETNLKFKKGGIE